MTRRTHPGGRPQLGPEPLTPTQRSRRVRQRLTAAGKCTRGDHATDRPGRQCSACLERYRAWVRDAS